MVKWLLVALLTVPLVDAAVLVWVGLQIGWPVTVLLVVLTALIGTLLVRAEGRRTIRKIQRSLAEGKPPTNELIDGGMLIAAGALLLTPGLVTDLIGFLFILPLTRIPIRMVLKSRVIVPRIDAETGGFATGRVYTAGFPSDGGRQDVDPSDFDLGDHPGTKADDDRSADQTGAGTVDLGEDEYDVTGPSNGDSPDDADRDRNP